MIHKTGLLWKPFISLPFSTCNKRHLSPPCVVPVLMCYKTVGRSFWMCASLSSFTQYTSLLCVWPPAFLFGIKDSIWAFMGYHSTQNMSVLAKAKVSHIRKTDGSLYPLETQIPISPIKVSNQIKLTQPCRFFCQNQHAENIPGSSAVNSQDCADLLNQTHMQVWGR